MDTKIIKTSNYALLLKDIVFCICSIIDCPLTLCKLAQVNKLFCSVVLTLSYYKSCKIIYNALTNHFIQDISDLSFETIRYGNLRLLKFLSINNIYSAITYDNFITGCQFDQLEICQWIINNNRTLIERIHANNEQAFHIACTNNNLKVARWLVAYGDSINSPINIHINEETVFIWSCLQGRSEIVKWLVDYAVSIDSPVDIHIENEFVFRQLCRLDRLDIIKWLIEYADSIGSPINICAEENQAFENACSNGKLNTLQWLFNYAKSINLLINIHANNERLFRITCSCEYLHLAKWLYEFSVTIDSKIVIHVLNDHLFKYSSQQIIDWLVTLD